MDERIKQGYHRIYSELFWIVFLLAAGSAAVNVIFFHKNMAQLWFEYVILAGSPVYRLIRMRMLEITDVPKPEGKKRMGAWLFFGTLGATAVFLAAEYTRFRRIEPRTVAVFLVPFVLMFLLTGCLVKALQRRWNKKLDRKYEEGGNM